MSSVSTSIPIAQVATLDEPYRRRARHVVTEDARVLQAVAALRANDPAQVGELFYASHASMRDDYEMSVPQVDALVEIASSDLAAGIPAFELLRRAGLAASNGEARRLIKGGGGRINDAAIADEARTVGLADVDANGVIKLSAGKKRHALIRAV